MIAGKFYVTNGDGESSKLTSEEQLERVITSSNGKRNLVILMHDSSTKQTTVDALPMIIEWLQTQEYSFALLR